MERVDHEDIVSLDGDNNEELQKPYSAFYGEKETKEKLLIPEKESLIVCFVDGCENTGVNLCELRLFCSEFGCKRRICDEHTSKSVILRSNHAKKAAALCKEDIGPARRFYCIVNILIPTLFCILCSAIVLYEEFFDWLLDD